MKKTYCGACRGERGCTDCKKAAKAAEYTGLAQFYTENDVPDAVWQGATASAGARSRQTVSSVTVRELLVAADIGTTTLAFACADGSGRVLASYGMENPQRKTAADVIGRIDAALRGERENLTNEIREALAKGFLFVLERAYAALREEGEPSERMEVRAAIAGNTTMQHLLLGYPVDGLAKAPFVPYSVEGRELTFAALFSKTEACAELSEAVRRAKITVFPCLSAFVGGDVAAGAYALFPQVWEKKVSAASQEGKVSDSGRQVRLLLDLGTNGELLLWTGDRVWGTAAAMGSAFEGGRFAYASDLFRLIAKAFREGAADETGLLREPYFTQGYEGLLQEDVREFQLAKGALRAGIELLCARAAVCPKAVDRVFVAGGIGQFCQPEDLFTAGLLPGAFRGKTEFVGNSCIGGLLRYLKRRETMLYCRGEILNLAKEPEFEEAYYRFMNFEAGE